MPKCPKQERLLEFATLSAELPFWERLSFGWHKFRCASCRESLAAIQDKWQNYFTPEPEIASSLIKVFSRLKSDETLILKGWKLDGAAVPRRAPERALKEGWLFRGGVSLGVAAAIVLVLTSKFKPQPVPQTQSASNISTDTPLAQIRYEQKHGVQVHYVKPELLQSIEFETTSGR